MKSNRFITFFKRALLAVVLIGSFALTSCDDDENGGDAAPTKTIWQLVQENGDLSSLETQLEAANLDSLLSADGQRTLFAPSNAAMATLLSTLGLDNFETISEQVTQAVLTYHVANSQYLADALTNGAEITTLQGEKIKVITTSTGEITFDTGATSDSKVTTSNITATNGVIHVVDVVLVPPTVGALIVETLGTVLQPLLLGADFTTLAGGIQKANAFAATQTGVPSISDILLNKVPGTEDMLFTVFAPTNGTFQAAQITPDSFNGQTWYGIIAHHIVGSDVTYGEAADFAQGTQFNTFATQATGGKKLTIIATDAPTNPELGIMTGIAIDSDGIVAPNEDPALNNTAEAQIAVLDVLAATGAAPADNGVINVIAGLLVPQKGQ